MIPLSEHLFCKHSGSLSARLSGRPTGQQLPVPLAYVLVVVNEFPPGPAGHPLRGVVPLWLTGTGAVCPQRAPREHQSPRHHNVTHKVLGALGTGTFSAQLCLLCGFGKITLPFCFSGPQLIRWGVLARSVISHLHHKTLHFRFLRSHQKGPKRLNTKVPHLAATTCLTFYFLLCIECPRKIAFGK